MNHFVYAMLLALAQAQVHIGKSPKESFMEMSPAYGQDWAGGAQFGAVLGFTVFGCAYLATVISIMIDIRKSGKMYEV